MLEGEAGPRPAGWTMGPEPSMTASIGVHGLCGRHRGGAVVVGSSLPRYAGVAALALRCQLAEVEKLLHASGAEREDSFGHAIPPLKQGRTARPTSIA